MMIERSNEIDLGNLELNVCYTYLFIVFKCFGIALRVLEGVEIGL